MNRTEDDLPVIGPTACFLSFPGEDPQAVLNTLTGELRLITAYELAVARGQPEGLRGFYASIPPDSRYFPAAARVAVIGATLLGDVETFDCICRDVANYASRAHHPQAGLAATVMDAWIRQWCHVSVGYPDWLLRFDFERIPDAWSLQVGFIGIRVQMLRRHFNTALTVSGLLQHHNRRTFASKAANVWLRMMSAVCCRELGRLEEMRGWYRQAAAEAGPRGFIVPFLSYVLGDGSVLDQILSEDAPGVRMGVRRWAETYFKNVILLHNRLVSAQVTDRLTRREFFIARQLKDGHDYQTIADMMGLSLGRLRNLISSVYGKLGIHKRTDLADSIW